jgi:hypothetical protein
MMNKMCPCCGSYDISEFEDPEVVGYFDGQPIYGNKEKYYECNVCYEKWTKYKGSGGSGGKRRDIL